MASAQKKRPLETDENTEEQELKRIRNMVLNYTLNDCIPIPDNTTIYQFLHCFKNLKDSFYTSAHNFNNQLLQHNGNINYQKIINDKIECKNILSIMNYIYYLFNDHLLIFIQMNMYYIFYTTEESSHYSKLLTSIDDLISYFNTIYDIKCNRNSNNISFQKCASCIYSTIKHTKFNNLHNVHSFYSKDLILKNRIFNIHYIIDSMYSIINYKFRLTGILINNLCIRRINYNFIDIIKKVRENRTSILKRVELSKCKNYISTKWLSNSKRFVKTFVDKKQKVTIEMIINDLNLNYIPNLKITTHDFIHIRMKETINAGLIVLIPTIHSLIDNINKEVLKYIATFKILKTKIARYNYNGNLDNLPICYYFRGRMNIIKDPEIHNKEITLSNLYELFEKNTSLPYGPKSSFNIMSDYKKYNRIIPNYRLYFSNPLNNPYWSIKKNIYPNNELILTILCMNNKNYYNSPKSLLSYLPEELWFMVFSFLKLSDMCGDVSPQQKLLFD